MREKRQTLSKEEKVCVLLTNSGIGALGQCAAASSKKLQAFWIILFLCAVTGFTLNVYRILERYYRVPVLTQLNQEFGNFTWPHITFCNPPNPIPFWRSTKLVEKWKKLLNESNQFRDLIYHGGNNKTVTREYLLMSSVTPHDFFNNPVSSVVLTAQLNFNQEMISTSSGSFDKYQYVRNFSFAFDKTLSSSKYPLPCLTLKPEALARLADPDRDPWDVMAIKLNLILDHSSYKIFNTWYENHKMYVYFSRPYQTLENSPLYFIYPGTGSSFIVTENHYKRILGCTKTRFTVEIYDSTMTGFRNYTGGFETCREFTSQMLYHEKCHCYNPFLPIYKVSDSAPRLCLNISLYNKEQLKKNLDCLNKVTAIFTQTHNFKSILDRACGKYRMPSCHQTSYTYLRSTNIWRQQANPRRRKMLLNVIGRLPNHPKDKNASLDFKNLNLATLRVYRTPGYVTAAIEEYEYPPSQLLSDIGGTLGLWLGISIISLFEIFQFIFQISHLFIKD